MRHTIARGTAASRFAPAFGGLGALVSGFIVLIERVAAAWHPAPARRLAPLRLPAPTQRRR